MNTAAPPPAPVSTASPAGYKWTVVGMLWFICFFNYADRQAIFSVFKVLERDLGFNKEELGLIGAAFTIVYSLTAPFAGTVGDRFPRKMVIIGGLYVWSLVTGFTALCSRVWHFVLVRGAEGLGETFYFPASMSLISDYHGRRTRSTAMSLHQTSVYAGTIGGGAFAGVMAQYYGWQWPFVILGGLGILLGLVLMLYIREPRRNEAERAEVGGAALESEPVQIPMSRFVVEWMRTPTAMLLVAAFFGANLVALLFLTWAPTFLSEKYRMGLAGAGLTGTFFIQAGSMVGAIFGGLMADRWRRAREGGRILTQAVGTLLGAPFIFLFGYTTQLGVLIVAMSLFGFLKGIYDSNIWASLYDVVAPSRRAAAVGLMNMVGWMGGALGAFSLGALVENKVVTMSQGFSYAASIYILVTALLLVAGLQTVRRDVARAAEPAAS